MTRRESQNKSLSISINEYLFRLVCADLSGGESHISKQGNEFTEEHRENA